MVNYSFIIFSEYFLTFVSRSACLFGPVIILSIGSTSFIYLHIGPVLINATSDPVAMGNCPSLGTNP